MTPYSRKIPGFPRIGLLAAAVVGLLPHLAFAAAPGSDPDWPCQQPLVPSVSAAMVWDGPPLEGTGDWRSDPTVATLVAKLADKDLPVDQGKAAIDQFIHARTSNRQRSITQAFAGLLEENNRARTRVIDNIKMLAERQRGLADVISRLTAERDKAGVNADPELVDRWAFARRTYYAVQRTVGYACEMPAELDQRLGFYARELEAGLP